MLQQPDVTRVRRTGFIPFSGRREEYGTDALGNEVYTGDEILVLNDEFFLKEPLLQETIEVLEILGATYEIAK